MIIEYIQTVLLAALVYLEFQEHIHSKQATRWVFVRKRIVNAYNRFIGLFK
jgi:hypothetical protein